MYVTPDSLTNSTAKQVGNQNSAPSIGFDTSESITTDVGTDDGIVLGDDEVVIDSGNVMG